MRSKLHLHWLPVRAGRASLIVAIVFGIIVIFAGHTALARPSGRRVTGIVLDPSNRPAASVQVRLIRLGKTVGAAPRGKDDSPTGDAVIAAPPAEGLQTMPSDLKKGETLAKPATVTDALGRFIFTEVADDKYIVLAGTGKSTAREPVFVAGEVDPAPVKLTLPAPK